MDLGRCPDCFMTAGALHLMRHPDSVVSYGLQSHHDGAGSTFLDLQRELRLLQVDLQGLDRMLHAAELAPGLVEVDHDALALLLRLRIPLLQVLQQPTSHVPDCEILALTTMGHLGLDCRQAPFLMHLVGDHRSAA